MHNGLHYLSVVGFNSSGQKAGTDTLLVKVINGTNVALTQPIANQTVYGQILIVTEMSPATTWEDVYIDGNYFASGPPLLFTWDTTTVGNGVHTVSVAGFDSSGNVIGFDDDNVRVENGDALITFPQSGNQVACTVLVDTQPLPADQWENLYVDGQYLQSGPPYNFIWDSTTVGNGSHTLSLRAFSSASGQVGADSIPIVVAN